MKEWKTIEEDEVFSCEYRGRLLTVFRDADVYYCDIRDENSYYQCGKAKSLEEAKKMAEAFADKIALTVAELIERLKDFPQDMEVVVQYRDDGGCYSGQDEYILLHVDKETGKLNL